MERRHRPAKKRRPRCGLCYSRRRVLLLARLSRYSTGAPHPENAHAFINYILDAEVGRDLAEYIEYATPNEAARKLTNDAYRSNSIIFPPESILGELEPSLYLGEEHSGLVEEQWTRILAANKLGKAPIVGELAL